MNSRVVTKARFKSCQVPGRLVCLELGLCRRTSEKNPGSQGLLAEMEWEAGWV